MLIIDYDVNLTSCSVGSTVLPWDYVLAFQQFNNILGIVLIQRSTAGSLKLFGIFSKNSSVNKSRALRARKRQKEADEQLPSSRFRWLIYMYKVYIRTISIQTEPARLMDVVICWNNGADGCSVKSWRRRVREGEGRGWVQGGLITAVWNEIRPSWRFKLTSLSHAELILLLFSLSMRNRLER